MEELLSLLCANNDVLFLKTLFNMPIQLFQIALNNNHGYTERSSRVVTSIDGDKYL